MRIGVELPLAGDDGAAGLAAKDALHIALGDGSPASAGRNGVELRIVDTAHGGFQNPHRDEGTDDSDLPKAAAAVVRKFAADPAVVLVIGGLRPHLAAADARAALRAGVNFLALAPLPDGCAAAGTPTVAVPSVRAIGPTVAVSVAGGASLESLAVAGVVSERRWRKLVVLDDGEPARAAIATCLKRVQSARHVTVMRRSRARNELDFRRLQTLVRVIRADGIVYVAPAAVGTLLCEARGLSALAPEATAQYEHREFDMRATPAACVWIARIVRPEPSSKAAAAAFARDYHARAFQQPSEDALSAAEAASVAQQLLETPAGTTDLRGALARRLLRGNYIASRFLRPLRGCSGWSADGAWFSLRELNSVRERLVEDARCTIARSPG